jgi:hypothetical protein
MGVSAPSSEAVGEIDLRPALRAQSGRLGEVGIGRITPVVGLLASRPTTTSSVSSRSIRSASGAARPDQTVWRGLQSVGRLFCGLTRVESVAPGRVGANAFDPLSGAVHPRSNPLRVRGGGLRLALLRRGPTTASSVSSSSLRSAFSAARLEKTVRGGLSPSDLTRGEPVAWGRVDASVFDPRPGAARPDLTWWASGKEAS